MKTKTVSTEQLKSLFEKSTRLLEQGDAAGAKKGLTKVVKKLPDSAAAWYNLGLCHQHLSEHREAVTAYRKVLRARADFTDAWVNLAYNYQVLGNLEEAEKAGQNALFNHGGHPGALNLMGMVRAQQGKVEDAKTFFQRCLDVQPDHPEALFNLANLYQELGDNDAALATAKPLFEAEPDNKQYRQLRAQVLLNKKEFNDAAYLVLELQDEFPEDEEALRLALAYREVVRDHFGAIEIAEKLLKRLPKDARLWNSLGGAYFQLDGIAKAKSCYEKAIELEPQHAEYRNNLGLAVSSLGDKDAAEKHYRKSISLNPRHVEAYRNLATMKRFKSMDDPDAQTVKSLFEQDDLDDFTAIKLSFALGKIYDDCGLYDEAFAAYKRGNDLKFRESRIDLDQYFAHLDRFAEVFDAPPRNLVSENIQPRPIFILGMPRSGTTLVEQIISRHPQVTGCGELPCIERAILRMEKKGAHPRVYPNDFWEVTVEELTETAVDYPAWVGRLHDIKTPELTDKMPFNFVHVWLIKTLFPDSPIVHCRRHPLDVITSNYFQLYGSDISFVYNLDALASYYVRYYHLMNHWAEIFGDGLIQIQYEGLVQDAETETRRLIDAVGLTWDDACLDARRSDTAVRTASIWQVRQGIYTSSKERWRNYEKFLGPVKEMLHKASVPVD